MPEWRAEVLRRLAGAQLEPTRENEIVEEIVQHLEDRHAELVARGRSPAEADAAVLAELDDNEVLSQRLRGVLRPAARDPIVPGGAPRGVAGDLFHDLRYAGRRAPKTPGSTAVTLSSLPLGTGPNPAISHLLNTPPLRKLPVARADELTIVRTRDRHWGSGRFNGSHPDLTYNLWTHLRDEQEAFAGMLAFGDRTVNLNPAGEARWARAMLVSRHYFHLLRLKPPPA